jgi:hypothetical protein
VSISQSLLAEDLNQVRKSETEQSRMGGLRQIQSPPLQKLD